MHATFHRRSATRDNDLDMLPADAPGNKFTVGVDIPGIHGASWSLGFPKYPGAHYSDLGEYRSRVEPVEMRIASDTVAANRNET